MSSRPLSLLLLLASLLLWSHTSIHAEQPLLLQRIEVHTSGSVEQVALKFSKAFREDPLINFDSGSMSLRLPHTRLDPSVPPLISPASNPLIRTIRATHADSGDYVRVDLHFRQDRRLRGNPEITYSTDQISLSLNHRPAATELPLVESSRLLEQAEQKLQEGDRFTSTFSRTEAAGAEPLTDGFPTPVYADDDWVRTLLSLVLALLFILLLIFLLAWFYNRFLPGVSQPLAARYRSASCPPFMLHPGKKWWFSKSTGSSLPVVSPPRPSRSSPRFLADRPPKLPRPGNLGPMPARPIAPGWTSSRRWTPHGFSLRRC